MAFRSASSDSCRCRRTGHFPRKSTRRSRGKWGGTRGARRSPGLACTSRRSPSGCTDCSSRCTPCCSKPRRSNARTRTRRCSNKLRLRLRSGPARYPARRRPRGARVPCPTRRHCRRAAGRRPPSGRLVRRRTRRSAFPRVHRSSRRWPCPTRPEHSARRCRGACCRRQGRSTRARPRRLEGSGDSWRYYTPCTSTAPSPSPTRGSSWTEAAP